MTRDFEMGLLVAASVAFLVAGVVAVFREERQAREAAEAEVAMARLGLLHPMARTTPATTGVAG